MRSCCGGLGADAEEALAKSVKQEALKTASVQTGIALGLNAIPVLGTALAALYSLVTMFTGRMMKKKMDAEQAKAKADIEAHAKRRAADVEKRQNEVADEEAVKAEQMVRAGVPIPPPKSPAPPKALNDWEPDLGAIDGWWGDLTGQARATVKRVGGEVSKALKTVTGQQGVEEFREKVGKVVESTKGKIDADATAQIQASESPEFRETVRHEVARQLVSMPQPAQQAVMAANRRKMAWIIGGSVAGLAVLFGAIWYLTRRKQA